jgi:hypothetical protein
MELSGSGQGPMADFNENVTELSGFIKGREFIGNIFEYMRESFSRTTLLHSVQQVHQLFR